MLLKGPISWLRVSFVGSNYPQIRHVHHSSPRTVRPLLCRHRERLFDVISAARKADFAGRRDASDYATRLLLVQENEVAKSLFHGCALRSVDKCGASLRMASGNEPPL